MSFQSPIPYDFPKGNANTDISGLALVDVGSAGGDMSGSSTISLNAIENFWIQFHNDNSQDFNAGVADLDSSSSTGEYNILLNSLNSKSVL